VDLGASTINIKMLTVCSLGGTGAIDPVASTINAKKHQRQAPWEVLEL
jgi:hypothetical protein